MHSYQNLNNILSDRLEEHRRSLSYLIVLRGIPKRCDAKCSPKKAKNPTSAIKALIDISTSRPTTCVSYITTSWPVSSGPRGIKARTRVTTATTTTIPNPAYLMPPCALVSATQSRSANTHKMARMNSPMPSPATRAVILVIGARTGFELDVLFGE